MNFYLHHLQRGSAPPLGVNFGQLQARLAGRLGRDVNLGFPSASTRGTTPRSGLRAVGASSSARRPGGRSSPARKRDVDRLLKGLGTFAPDKSEHTPLRPDRPRSSGGRWQARPRADPGRHPSPRIILDRLGPPPPGPGPGPVGGGPGRRRGTSATVPLLDQGPARRWRLYSDLLKGKGGRDPPRFFTSCRGSCSQLIDTFTKLQNLLRGASRKGPVS